MRLTVNELCLTLEAPTTLEDLRGRLHPGADLIILNGAPVPVTHPLAEGDRVVFIRRGATPSRDELEGLMAARHTPGVFGCMKAASVGIAGVGGLGSAVAVALARMGVGRLVIADGDLVEPSNLNRQQYFTDQIGEPKAEALAGTLARVNPFCRVQWHVAWLNEVSIPRIFAGCPVVVEAFDRAEAKRLLIDTVLRQLPGVHVVAASGLAGIGPAGSIVTREVADRLWVVGDLATEAAPGTGLMSPRVGVAAHLQANAVVRLLLGLHPVEDRPLQPDPSAGAPGCRP